MRLQPLWSSEALPPSWPEPWVSSMVSSISASTDKLGVDRHLKRLAPDSSPSLQPRLARPQGLALGPQRWCPPDPLPQLQTLVKWGLLQSRYHTSSLQLTLCGLFIALGSWGPAPAPFCFVQGHLSPRPSHSGLPSVGQKAYPLAIPSFKVDRVRSKYLPMGT